MGLKMLRNLLAGNCSHVVVCFIQIFVKSIGMCGMVCHIMCLSVVFMNIDRINTVMEVKTKIAKLEDLKQEIDSLNTTTLGYCQADSELLHEVKEYAIDLNSLVGAFIEKLASGTVHAEEYDQ